MTKYCYGMNNATERKDEIVGEGEAGPIFDGFLLPVILWF